MTHRPDRERIIKECEWAIARIEDYGSTTMMSRSFFADVEKLLNEQEAVRWIPVMERLPKSMANKVIVYLQHEDLVPEIGYGHYEKYKGVEMWYNLETNEQFSKRGYTVTHWMPMPKSPEGEKLVLY